MAYQVKLEDIQQDQDNQIPWIVRFLENPSSLIWFPGQINLDDHDRLHLKLNREISSKDEAFVVGFTIGMDKKAKSYHLLIFRIFAQYFYPVKFRMSNEDWVVFLLGFYYGKKISRSSSIDNLNLDKQQLYKLKEIEDILFSY